MRISANAPRRAGFTLIELLTVVAIIALLIGILMPSLSRARDQAKRAKVAGMLSAIDKGLEMFHNDFKQYPDSKYRKDPIEEWPGELNIPQATAARNYLSGAHWLARALVGHDTDGVDAKGVMLGDGEAGMLKYNSFLPIDPVTSKQGVNANRKGTYLEGEIFIRDDDTNRLPGAMPASDVMPTGRMLVVDDAYDSPVLYYRANTRMKRPFSVEGLGGDDPQAIYTLNDNAAFTGWKLEPSVPSSIPSWDFAVVGKLGDGSEMVHPLGKFFVDYENTLGTESVDDYPGSFTEFLHSESAHKSVNKIKTVNAERFILITAGKDGRYGTEDDITNFESGL